MPPLIVNIEIEEGPERDRLFRGYVAWIVASETGISPLKIRPVHIRKVFKSWGPEYAGYARKFFYKDGRKISEYDIRCACATWSIFLISSMRPEWRILRSIASAVFE